MIELCVNIGRGGGRDRFITYIRDFFFFFFLEGIKSFIIVLIPDFRALSFPLPFPDIFDTFFPLPAEFTELF